MSTAIAIAKDPGLGYQSPQVIPLTKPAAGAIYKCQCLKPVKISFLFFDFFFTGSIDII
jgi:hypothetical protein